MISTKQFLATVENNVKDYFLEKSKDNVSSDDLEVIQVWYSKNVQNHKGMFIVRDKVFGTIYSNYIEATYNGDAQELYLDFYIKEFKHTIKITE